MNFVYKEKVNRGSVRGSVRKYNVRRLGQTWQIPKESLDRGGECFGLPLNVVLQIELVGFPPVQTHRHQLGDLAGHSHHAVHALVLQTPALQGRDTVLEEKDGLE